MADIQQIYFTTLTAVGEAKDAKAKALGTPIKFTEMAVGDGGGVLPVPDRTRTALVNMKRKALINTLKQDPKNPGQLIAEQVIPEDEGGWWIRELGLYDSDGDLFAIANCPETYKPVLAQGSGRTQVVRMVLVMTSAASVQLKVDPSVVLATRQYVDDQDAAHAAAADPHPQYLTEAEGQARIAAAIAALVASSPSTLDTLAELAAALGNDKDFAATMMAALGLKAPLASPALTGNPTAPTQARISSSTRLATMEALRKNGSSHSAVVQYSGNAALTAADAVGNLVIAYGTQGPVTFTLPRAADCFDGASISFFNAGGFPITLNAGAGTDYINIGAGNRASVTIKPGETLNLSLFATPSAWQCFGGSAQLANAGGFKASFMRPGYAQFPNGLILQFGLDSSGDDLNGRLISFPIAFPNTALIVMATDSGNVCAASGCTPISTTQFKLYGKDYNGNYGSFGLFWFAIGF